MGHLRIKQMMGFTIALKYTSFRLSSSISVGIQGPFHQAEL